MEPHGRGTKSPDGESTLALRRPWQGAEPDENPRARLLDEVRWVGGGFVAKHFCYTRFRIPSSREVSTAVPQQQRLCVLLDLTVSITVRVYYIRHFIIGVFFENFYAVAIH